MPEGHTNSQSNSSSAVVLVNEPAQDVPPSNPCAVDLRENRIRSWVRRLELETSVGPSPVVVAGVDLKHPLKVASTEHQNPVQTLGPDRADPVGCIYLVTPRHQRVLPLQRTLGRP